MSKLINVDEGMTYDYLAHGLGVLVVVGGLGWVVHPLITLLGFVGGIALMVAKGGLHFDLNQKRMRTYTNFIGYKAGQWISLQDVQQAKIQYHNETSRGSLDRVSNTMAGNPSTGAVLCYDLCLIKMNGDEQVVHSFTKKKPAFETAKILKESFGIEVENYLLKMQQVLGKSRKR